MPTIKIPDYEGGSIVNLTATLEHRLTGTAPAPLLHDRLASSVSDTPGYVVVLFDGLGSNQLDHASAEPLRDRWAGDLDTVFPATTTVALASLSTGMTPAGHGLLGYQLWLPELEAVANTIKWTTLWGAPLDYDTRSLLPQPNLWERLAQAGVEAITIQPANFDRSPLTKALYRGARFEPAATYDDIVRATLELAGPGRLLFTYLPPIDFAAHVHGQASNEYDEAIQIAATVWHKIEDGLGPEVGLVGTADHGHIDFPSERQVKIAKPDHEGRTFYGDGRAMFVRGDGSALAERLPATWIPIDEARPWWGNERAHPTFKGRAPDGVLLADDDALLLHRFSDDRMVGNHGAMTNAEQRVPLLTGPA